MSDAARPGAEHGVVAPVRVDAAGVTGPTKRQAAGPEWRTTSRGRYVPVYVDASPDQRVVEAGVLAPANGAITGWGSLRWRRGRWFTGDSADGTPLPVPLALTRRTIRPQPLVHLCGERFDLRECEVIDGIRVTTAARSVAYEMRYARSLDAAVVALDMACFDDLVSLDEVAAWVARHPSWTGIEQARLAVRLADENAWSPQETTMRLDWSEGTVLANRPVFDLHGRHLGTPDLLDPVAGVFGGYEGGLHLTGARRSEDLRREERLCSHGLEAVTKVSADLREPGPYRERVRSAYLRASRRPSSERRWTLELPDWWRSTLTVAQRRALDATERAVWLRRQAG